MQFLWKLSKAFLHKYYRYEGGSTYDHLIEFMDKYLRLVESRLEYENAKS